MECFGKGMLIKDIVDNLGISHRLIYDQMNFIKKKGIRIKPIKEGNKVLRYDIEGYGEI